MGSLTKNSNKLVLPTYVIDLTYSVLVVIALNYSVKKFLLYIYSINGGFFKKRDNMIILNILYTYLCKHIKAVLHTQCKVS